MHSFGEQTTSTPRPQARKHGKGFYYDLRHHSGLDPGAAIGQPFGPALHE